MTSRRQRPSNNSKQNTQKPPNGSRQHSWLQYIPSGLLALAQIIGIISDVNGLLQSFQSIVGFISILIVVWFCGLYFALKKPSGESWAQYSISILVVFISGIWGGIRLWNYERDILTYSLIGFAVVTQILLFVLIFRDARLNKKPINSETKRKTNKDFVDSAIKRETAIRLMLFNAIIILLYGLAIGYTLYDQSKPSDKLRIVVATFNHPEENTYKVTSTILSQLRSSLKNYDNIEVLSLDTAISEEDGDKLARLEGQRHKADFVIWGWYSVTSEAVIVNVHFERIPLVSSFTGRQQAPDDVLRIGTIEQLERFDFQLNLASEVVTISQFTIGLTLYYARDYQTAEQLFTEALQSIPENNTEMAPWVYLYRGQARFHNQELQNALQDFEQTIFLKPNHKMAAYAYNGRGIIHDIRGNFELAIRDFTKAIELEPAAFNFIYHRAQAYRFIGNYDLAIRDYTSLINIFSNLKISNSVLYLDRGKLYLNNKQFTEAVNDFSEAIRQDPQSPIGYQSRAEAYFSFKEYDLAINDHDEAVRVASSDPGVLTERGKMHFYLGNYDLAINDFSKAIKLDSNTSRAYFFRGLTYWQRGELDFAIADLSQTIALDETDYSAYNNRGLVYQAKGQLKEAISDFNQAIEINPKYAKAYFNRGNILSANGDTGSAFLDYNKAIALEPENPSTWYNRGFLYYNQRNFSKAIADFSAAIAITDHVDYYYFRGMSYKETGQFYLAKNDFLKALTLTKEFSRQQELQKQINEIRG